MLEVLRTSTQCRNPYGQCSRRAGWIRDVTQSCSTGLQLAFDWAERQEQSEARCEARGPSAVFGIICLLRFKLEP